MIDWTQAMWTLIIPIAVFAILACAEVLWPRQALVLGRRRWLTHLGFFGINVLTSRLIAVVSVASAASFATNHNFGVFALLPLPLWFEMLLALIVYDAAVWLQHRAMHISPLLWRAHQVHHSDRDLDVTTALRFHPFELIVSTLYKSAIIILLGVPVWVAIVLELWLNANALFNHSNVKLPNWLNRGLRTFLVTPDMHVIHHSIDPNEQRHNFGFGLNIWDRIFGTYMDSLSSGKPPVEIGLDFAQTPAPGRLIWSLWLPFRWPN